MEKRKQEQKELELQEMKTVITNKMKDLYREKLLLLFNSQGKRKNKKAKITVQARVIILKL